MRVINGNDRLGAHVGRIGPSGENSSVRCGNQATADHRIVPLRAASTEMPFSVRMLPMARSSAARALT